MNNATVLFDSTYKAKTVLKPIHHLQCKLRMHDISKGLLKDSGIVTAEAHIPSLICVMDDMPEVSYSTQWGEGAITTTFGPLDKFLTSSPLANYISAFADNNFISIAHTNEFSQHMMQESSYLSLQLQFRVYADSYNQRYRFMTSTYETWLKTLYFATAPLVPSTYSNFIANVIKATGNSINVGGELLTTLTDAAPAAVSLAQAFVSEDADFETLKKDSATVVSAIKNVATKIAQLQERSTVFGHVVYDVEIPGFINSTIKSSTPVYWIVQNFTATPCPQFLRGLYNHEAKKLDNGQTIYRPKPLYIDFNVTLQTNQKLSREQLIALFLASNQYRKLKSKQQEQPAT